MGPAVAAPGRHLHTVEGTCNMQACRQVTHRHASRVRNAHAPQAGAWDELLAEWGPMHGRIYHICIYDCIYYHMHICMW